MKGWGQLALAILCAAGSVSWVWKLSHGMPLTFETGFLTAGAISGTVLFAVGAVKEFRK